MVTVTTMATTSYISQLLNTPGTITPADKDTIDAIIGNYPYFVPARYLQAALQHKEEAYAPHMLDNMQLYMGNPVSFAAFLQNKPVEEEKVETSKTEEPLIQAVYTEDYFLQQGIEVSNELPIDIDHTVIDTTIDDKDQSLMVVMSFAEWLQHFKSQSQKAKEEAEGQKALRSMWQKEKLAAAMEEENEEIPENVFEMAMNSIASEEGLVSESLADIYIKQKKYDRAIEMYKKLSLRNPQKSAYFARKIEGVLKDKQS